MAARRKKPLTDRLITVQRRQERAERAMLMAISANAGRDRPVDLIIADARAISKFLAGVRD